MNTPILPCSSASGGLPTPSFHKMAVSYTKVRRSSDCRSKCCQPPAPTGEWNTYDTCRGTRSVTYDWTRFSTCGPIRSRDARRAAYRNAPGFIITARHRNSETRPARGSAPLAQTVWLFGYFCSFIKSDRTRPASERQNLDT